MFHGSCTAVALSDISHVTFHCRLLTPCSAVSHHHERVILEFAGRRSAGSYTPKSRSINLIRKLPRHQKFSLETSTFIAPSGRHRTASCTLSDGGYEPSTPPEIQPHFRSVPKVIKLSLLHTNTMQSNTRRDEAPKRKLTRQTA